MLCAVCIIYRMTFHLSVDFHNCSQDDGELPGCVPLTYCYISRKSQFITVSDIGGFQIGEIFYPTLDNISQHDTDQFITGYKRCFYVLFIFIIPFNFELVYILMYYLFTSLYIIYILVFVTIYFLF